MTPIEECACGGHMIDVPPSAEPTSGIWMFVGVVVVEVPLFEAMCS